MNYEAALEAGMEQSFGGLIVRPAIGDKKPNPHHAANNAYHECESDKHIQLCATNFVSNANNNSIRAAIVPAISPIDRTGVSFTPRDATKFQSGFSESSAELSRDLPPDNSEPMYLYCSKYIAPFSFCLMANVPTVLCSSVSDNSETSVEHRHEHPSSMDKSANERIH